MGEGAGSVALIAFSRIADHGLVLAACSILAELTHPRHTDHLVERGDRRRGCRNQAPLAAFVAIICVDTSPPEQPSWCLVIPV